MCHITQHQLCYPLSEVIKQFQNKMYSLEKVKGKSDTTHMHFYIMLLSSTCYKLNILCVHKKILQNNSDHHSTTLQQFMKHIYLQP